MNCLPITNNQTVKEIFPGQPVQFPRATRSRRAERRHAMASLNLIRRRTCNRIRWNSSAQFIVSIVSVRNETEPARCWPSRLSWNTAAFVRPLLPFYPPLTLRALRSFLARETKNSLYYAGKKKNDQVRRQTVHCVLLRCPPPLFSGELFTRTCRGFTCAWHNARRSLQPATRTMPIYRRDFRAFSRELSAAIRFDAKGFPGIRSFRFTPLRSYGGTDLTPCSTMKDSWRRFQIEFEQRRYYSFCLNANYVLLLCDQWLCLRIRLVLDGIRLSMNYFLTVIDASSLSFETEIRWKAMQLFG